MKDKGTGDNEEHPPAGGHEAAAQPALGRAEKQQDSRWNQAKKYWGESEKWLPTAALVITAVSAMISVAMWFAQLDANGINRRILAASESASIYFGSVKMMNLAHPDEKPRESILVEIGNSSGSPTSGLVYRLACKPAKGEIGDAFDRALLKTAKEVHLALGPKQVVTPVACSYTAPELALTAVANLSIYVFGESSYRDTIFPDRRHKVRFCIRMHSFAFGMGTTSPTGIYAISEHCESHNCYDADCPD